MSKFKEGVERLLQAGTDIVRTEDERNYLHVPTGQLLDRTTSWISGNAPFFLPEIWQGALAVGTAVDQACRDYFVEPEVMSPFRYMENIQERAYQQLVADLDKWAPSIEGWDVHADRVYFYSLELGVAGEVDLLLTNEKTEEIWIVDFKTSRAGTKSFGKKYGGKASKQVKYRLQLNTYRYMAEELSGFPVKRISILPIKVFYEPFKASTSEAYFEPMIDVEILDPIEERSRLLGM